MKLNFNPRDGKKLLTKIRDNVPNYSATINSLHIIPEKHPQQVQSEKASQNSHGIADIEEVPDVDDPVFVQSVLVNNIKIGKACCPYELI